MARIWMASVPPDRRKTRPVFGVTYAGDGRRPFKAATAAPALRAPLDPQRRFVVVASPKRLRQRAPDAPAYPYRDVRIRNISSSERGAFRTDQRRLEKPSYVHWLWASFAFLLVLALAGQNAFQGPSLAGGEENWQSFGLWTLYVATAASVLVLSWRNAGSGGLVCAVCIALLAWRSPFASVGLFEQDPGTHWYLSRIPWWSLLAVTCIVKALETRGPRRVFQGRTLMVVQVLQLVSYALLVLLSIFLLGRAGSLDAEWGLTMAALLVGWFIQGRSLLVMWQRDVLRSTPMGAARPNAY